MKVGICACSHTELDHIEVEDQPVNPCQVPDCPCDDYEEVDTAEISDADTKRMKIMPGYRERLQRWLS